MEPIIDAQGRIVYDPDKAADVPYTEVMLRGIKIWSRYVTIISDYNEDIEIACDGCGFVLETDTDDFAAARRLMRKIFWTTESHRGPGGLTKWSHFCSLCRQPPTRRRAHYRQPSQPAKATSNRE